MLLAISLMANIALGYVVAELRSDFDNASAVLDDKLVEAEDRLDARIASAEQRIPDVDDIQNDLTDLERATFGPLGPRFQTNAIGTLEDEIDSLKSCFNRNLFTAFNNFERYVFNDYAFTYYIPRCF